MFINDINNDGVNIETALLSSVWESRNTNTKFFWHFV